jgi:hypothetical protein
VEAFEASEFCRQHQCVRYATDGSGGVTSYYYQTSLSGGFTGVTVRVSRGGAGQYYLNLQPVNAEGLMDEARVEWEDPQAVLDLFTSVAVDRDVTDAMRRQVNADLLQHLDQICEAEPIDLGLYRAWIGRVQFYAQTVVIAAECPR